MKNDSWVETFQTCEKKIVLSLCHLSLVPYDTSIVLQYNVPVEPILA